MKQIFRRVGLAFGGIVFTCLLLEIAIRLADPRTLDAPLEERWKSLLVEERNSLGLVRIKDFDPVFHHGDWPKRDLQGSLEGRPYHYTTNAQGFRGPADFSVTKPADTYRIAVLGDSFTEGLYVDDTETYVAQLQQKLARTPGAKKWEVMNFGQTSYSPLLYWQLYEHRVRTYKPDMIIVAIDNSDIQDDYFYEQDAVFDSKGEVIKFNDTHYAFFLGQSRVDGSPVQRKEELSRQMATFGGRFRGRLLSHSHLAVLVRDVWQKKQIRFGDIKTDRYGHLRPGVNWEPHWKRSEKYLTKLFEAARRDHVDMFLLYYPYGMQINGTEWPGRVTQGFKMGQVYDTPLRTWLATFALHYDLGLLDAVGWFQQNSQERFCYDHDPHFLPNGHMLIANILSGIICQNYNLKQNPAKP